MEIAQLKIISWDKIYNCEIDSGIKIGVDDQVVVKCERGLEIGTVTAINEIDDDAKNIEIGGQVLRKVTTDDLNHAAEFDNKKNEAIEFCKQSAERRGLPMKIVDAHFSLDGGRLTYAFIADGRIDFRDLVKDLTHYFQKSIRLHQLGIRDEAKMAGDIGVCGRPLCCANHLKELTSITSDMADLQQVAHRGSDRLSGICGRLRCCLSYEKDVYIELTKKLPPIGSTVKTTAGKGVVVGIHVIKQTFDLAIDGEKSNIVEVPAKSLKK